MEMPERSGGRVRLSVVGRKPLAASRICAGCDARVLHCRFAVASLSSLLQAAFFTPAILQEWKQTWVRFENVNEVC